MNNSERIYCLCPETLLFWLISGLLLVLGLISNEDIDAWFFLSCVACKSCFSTLFVREICMLPVFGSLLIPWNAICIFLLCLLRNSVGMQPPCVHTLWGHSLHLYPIVNIFCCPKRNIISPTEFSCFKSHWVGHVLLFALSYIDKTILLNCAMNLFIDLCNPSLLLRTFIFLHLNISHKKQFSFSIYLWQLHDTDDPHHSL